MLNRLLQPTTQNRGAYIDATGRITRTWNDVYAGVDVNTETALSVPAIWRATTMISDIVGMLEIHAYRNDQRLEPNARILEKPVPFETRVTTFSAMAAAMILHGNFIAVLGDPGPSGYPETFYPVNPERVSIHRVGGEPIYRISRTELDGTSTTRDYTASQILHIPYFKLPGEVAGVGIVAAQRQGIGAAVAVLEYAARYFDGGAMPSYLIKSDNPDLTQDESDGLKQKWMEHYGGRSRIPAVMNASTDIKELTANANDSQLIEARQQSLSDASNIVGVPGTYVNAPNTTRTYSNVESQALELLRTSIMPFTSRIEAALSDLLPRGQEAKFSYDSLLRADTLSRYQAYQMGLSAGFLTIDEVRELEDRPPIGVPPENMPEEIPA